MPTRTNLPQPAASESEIAALIRFVRDQKVILDRDLAAMYEVEVRTLNQAVRRNVGRFPPDFMFRLTPEEVDSLRSQFVILNTGTAATSARAPSLRGRHSKYLPVAFTEQGVAMLSSVLRSDRAILVNVEIMRTFVRLRALLTSNAELARKLDSLEAKYDKQFKIVFDAIRQMMAPPPTSRRRIGFAPWGDEGGEGG